MDDELIGIYEIAELAGVTPPAVANWRKRAKDFPKPHVELRAGPIFRRNQIRSILFKLRGLPINKYIRYRITSTLDAKKVFYKELKSSFKVSSAV